eukprot:6187966-Pyramimonas_sp.AAC.1
MTWRRVRRAVLGVNSSGPQRVQKCWCGDSFGKCGSAQDCSCAGAWGHCKMGPTRARDSDIQ